jgi:hypothetical protein
MDGNKCDAGGIWVHDLIFYFWKTAGWLVWG